MRTRRLSLIAVSIFVLSCGRDVTPSNGTDTSAAAQTSPSSSTATLTASAATSPADQAATSVELVQAKEAGYIDYVWSGTGDSQSMSVKVVNKTEREWQVEIEVGTKLEPSNEAVQSMIVTNEVHVTMHPHDSQTVEVEVSCLDISRDPPATSDDAWKVTASPRLASFIACVKRDDPTMMQEALWYFRGATRDDWIEYFTKYEDKSEAEAEKAADSIESEIGQLARNCAS